MPGKKTNEMNYASYTNRKKLLPNRHYDNSKETRSLKGTKLLQRIGNSPAECKSFAGHNWKVRCCVPPAVRRPLTRLAPQPHSRGPTFLLTQSGQDHCRRKLDELSVEKLFAEICNERLVLQYFPARYVKDPALGYKRLRMPHRDWAFSIYHTVMPTEYNDFLKRNKAENRGRIKARENQGFSILEDFAEKAEEYDVMHYDKGTMHASIINKAKKVDAMRKRDLARNQGQEVESSSESEMPCASDEEDDQIFEGDGAMPDHVETKKQETERVQLTKVVKGLEVKLRMSAWDQTKYIEDQGQRAEEYLKISEYLEKFYAEFDLKMPTFEEALEIYE